jgi:hypothetical protein
MPYRLRIVFGVYHEVGGCVGDHFDGTTSCRISILGLTAEQKSALHCHKIPHKKLIVASLVVNKALLAILCVDASALVIVIEPARALVHLTIKRTGFKSSLTGRIHCLPGIKAGTCDCEIRSRSNHHRP